MADRRLTARSDRQVVIGYNDIKRRRREQLTVDCHPGTMVGDYVPFYFCPRPVMLYVIYRRNSALRYQGGQDEIVHLVSAVETVVASAQDRPWAFSKTNAGAYYTRFFCDLDSIHSVLDWDAINAADWRDPAVKENKQAEFLVHDHVPWESVHEIGVLNSQVLRAVDKILERVEHRPAVVVRPEWYY